MTRNLLLLISLMLTTAVQAAIKTGEVTSPDGKLNVTVMIDDRQSLLYNVTHDGTRVLAMSHVALHLDNGKTLGEGIKKCKFKVRDAGDAYWHTLAVETDGYAVVFRVSNDCVAYRFETQRKGQLAIAGETAEFALPTDCMTYAALANSRVSDTDDFRQQAFCSFENAYQHLPVSKLNRKHLWLSPMLVELEQGKKLLIGEMNVLDYPGMFLVPSENNLLEGYFAPIPKTEHQGGHNNLQMLVDDWQDRIAITEGRRMFPWRMMVVADNDAQLLSTESPRRLAEPSRLTDASWIKPGKVAWDWWNAWNLTGVDFEAGINNDTYKYYIDFASRYGIEYVILDEGWAVNKQADLMQVVPEIDLPMLVKYARERNVGLVLWAGYKAFARNMEGVCRHYADMGIKGFKIDFMDRNDQPMMRFLQDAAEVCARHQLFVDFHGAPTPNGFTITYPNVLNFEAVAGLEQVKWSTVDQYDEVRHETILPFIRQVVGPMDYTQGAMRNATRKNYFKCYTQPMSQGTRCRQLALYMILDSPFNMLCDSPTMYEANPECTQFISAIPTVWDEVRVLKAELGKCVVRACRKGDTWWIGGITDWDARDLSVNLDFIAGKRHITLFTDGRNAHRQAEDFSVTDREFLDNIVNIHLAPGGGFAAKITVQ